MVTLNTNASLTVRAITRSTDTYAPINVGAQKPTRYNKIAPFLDLAKSMEVRDAGGNADLGVGGAITNVPTSYLQLYISGAGGSTGNYEMIWSGDDFAIQGSNNDVSISTGTFTGGSGTIPLTLNGTGNGGIKIARPDGFAGILNLNLQILPVGTLSNGKTAAEMIAAGEYCTPEFVDTFMQDGKPPICIRVMDWCGNVGDISYRTSADVKTLASGSWQPIAPAAVMCSLVKQTGTKYLWTCVSSRADSTFRQAFYQQIKDNLPVGRIPICQWSNETFNSIKSETQWGTADAARVYRSPEPATFTYDDAAAKLTLVSGTVPTLAAGDPICLATGNGRYRKVTASDATSITVDGSMDPALTGTTVQIILVDYNMVYSWQAQKSYETYQDATTIFGAGNFLLPIDFRLGDGAAALDYVINPSFWTAVDPGHPAVTSFMDFTTISSYFGRYAIYTSSGVNQALLDKWNGTNGVVQDQAGALADFDVAMNAALDDMTTYMVNWSNALAGAGITEALSIRYEGAQHALFSWGGAAGSNSAAAVSLVLAWLNHATYAPAAALRWVDIQRQHCDVMCQYLSTYGADANGAWGGCDGKNGPTEFYRWVRKLGAAIAPAQFRVA